MIITVEKAEVWKQLAASMIDLIPGGVIFATTDRECVNWKLASASFDIPKFVVGVKVRTGGAHTSACKIKKKNAKISPAVFTARVRL